MNISNVCHFICTANPVVPVQTCTVCYTTAILNKIICIT